MTRSVLYFLTYFLGIILQFSWMRYLSPLGISPNLILVTLVFIGLRRGPMPGTLMGFAWGLSWDALSVDLFGSHAFLFTTIGYLSGLLSHKWNEDKVITQVVLTGLVSVFFWGGMYVLSQVFGSDQYSFKVNYVILVQPFYNMLVAPLIFALGTAIVDRYAVETNEF